MDILVLYTYEVPWDSYREKIKNNYNKI